MQAVQWGFYCSPLRRTRLDIICIVRKKFAGPKFPSMFTRQLNKLFEAPAWKREWERRESGDAAAGVASGGQDLECQNTDEFRPGRCFLR